MSKRVRGFLVATLGLAALIVLALVLVAVFNAQGGTLVGQQGPGTATPVPEWVLQGWPTPRIMATVPCPSCPPGFTPPPTRTPVTPITTPPPLPTPTSPNYTPPPAPDTSRLPPSVTPLPITSVIDLAPELSDRDKALALVRRCDGTYVVIYFSPSTVRPDLLLCFGDELLGARPPYYMMGRYPTNTPTSLAPVLEPTIEPSPTAYLPSGPTASPPGPYPSSQ